VPPVERKQAIEACYIIPGWCFPTELGAIYDMVGRSRLHVELGTFCGRSLFAAVAALAADARVVAIDPLKFTCPSAEFPLPSAKWPAAVWQATLAAIREVRPDVVVEHWAKPSLDAARDFSWPIDTIYFDADHHYAEVMGELEAWYPLVRSGGTLFGHDYWAVQPGVIEAVQEFFGRRALSFELLSQTRIWVHRKP
jgi:hypothetical protein